MILIFVFNDFGVCVTNFSIRVINRMTSCDFRVFLRMLKNVIKCFISNYTLINVQTLRNHSWIIVMATSYLWQLEFIICNFICHKMH